MTMRALQRSIVVLAAVCLTVSQTPLPARSASPYVAARAQGRAEGNDHSLAVMIGDDLLATVLPAQVLKIRVDTVLGHHVAGIVLSGVHFHRSLDVAAYLAEVASVMRSAFAHAPVEEVDLWTTVPLDAGVGATVSGDGAAPTSRDVFAVTVRRSDLAHIDSVLRSNDIYWDAQWRAGFERSQGRQKVSSASL
jgi:hypothetical protein